MGKPVVLITGASRGIGAATASMAAGRGWAVAVNFRQDEPGAAEVVRRIVQAGGEAIALRADVSSESEVEALFGSVASQLGPPSALVNNAGILFPQMRLEEMDAERISRVFAVNVVGAFLCAREAVRSMSTRHGGRGGSIVNVSSAASRLGSPSEYIDYAASKGALDTLTIGLAKEVAAEGIRVAAVRPGLIATDIHKSGGEAERIQRLRPQIPMQRGGTPDEVAGTILWLLSDDAAYATGAIIDVAGGR